jgi:site-specific DNA recombinase
MEGGKETMKKAFVIIRVSSQDQLKGYGPDVQWFDDVIPNAQLLGLEVSEKYRRVIQESATTWERAKFDSLMKEALSLYQKDEIEALLFPRVDRETRFIFGSFPLLCEVVRSGLKVFFARERFELDPNNPESTERYLNKATQAQAYIETLKINTMRGQRNAAKRGQVPHGGFTFLYGYNYIRKAAINGGKRVINELESEWVKKIYRWLVEDGMSTHQITYKLRDLKVPTKHNAMWCPAAVRNILRNPAYTGRTYAFTTVNGKQFGKKKEDWIELPNVTPAIIPIELFEAAKQRLSLNIKNSTRNSKRQYLLRGHLRCKLCDRAYYGRTSRDRINGERVTDRRYCCSGKLKMVVPVDRCSNRSWQAAKLESMVWTEIERVLENPELIIKEIEKQRQDANELGVFEVELRQVERQLKALDRDHAQLLQWALKGFPEDQVIAENKKLNAGRERLKAQRAELEMQIKAGQEAIISLPKLEHFVELIRQKLTTLDFETKRQVLDMLGIKVWLNGDNVEITGVLPIEEDAIVTTQP